MSDNLSITGAALIIDHLLYACRNGTFYADHDDSVMMIADAEEALAVLTDAALKYEDLCE